MAILQLITSPDPLLKRKSQPVEVVDDALRLFLDDMLETMYEKNGIGLAAVQVGVLKRILLMDVGRSSERYPDKENTEGDESAPLFIINPHIVWQSTEVNTYEEGCLSFPGQYADVIRPAAVDVKYLDYNGQNQLMKADGLLATCVQHEIDHLNGITFVDHLSRMKRNMILKKMQKTND